MTADADASGWYALLPPAPPARRLEGRLTADWVVAGAGFTGLAAARRLAELQPNARIALVEAYRPGFGSCGRNSGFVIDVPHYTSELGVEQNRRLGGLVRAGLTQLGDLAATHGIDCAWDPQGHFNAAEDDAGLRALEAQCEELEALGEPYEWVDAGALRQITGLSHHRAAIRLPRTVLMQPAALARGLGATLPENVTVYEESPVTAVHPGDPVRVVCRGGEIAAKGLLLTTNAYSTQLGFFKGQVFPIRLFASLTRPLNDTEMAALGGSPEWGTTPAATMGSTLRRTRDNRILYRSVVRYGGEFRLDARERIEIPKLHRAGFRSEFPMLGDVEFEHCWSGVICMTRNKAAIFDRVAPGVFASGAYNGVGVARGTISGSLLAEYALGGDSELIRDVRSLSGPNWLPPEPIMAIVARTRLAVTRWSVTRQRARERRRA